MSRRWYGAACPASIAVASRLALAVTTLPAPMVHPLPIVTPAMMIVPPPTQVSRPMLTGKLRSSPSFLSFTETEWVPQ